MTKNDLKIHGGISAFFVLLVLDAGGNSLLLNRQEQVERQTREELKSQ